MNISYKRAKDDFEALAGIDSNGDFVEIDASVFVLMANPTREHAKELYLSSIAAWFNSARTDQGWRDCAVDSKHLSNPVVIKIAKRHDVDIVLIEDK